MTASTSLQPPLRWAARLPASSSSALGSIRLWPDVRLAVDMGLIWLAGDGLTSELDAILRQLPGAERFQLGDENALIPAGHRVPIGRLPVSLQWRSIRESVQVAAPPAALSGSVEGQVRLTLVRTTTPAETNLLELPWAVFRAWAVGAPAIRLVRLGFVLARDGRAIVRGLPLPPLGGNRFVESEGVAVAAGYAIYPVSDPAVVRSVCQTTVRDLLLFRESGDVQLIAADSFVAASRSAIRATDEAISKS